MQINRKSFILGLVLIAFSWQFVCGEPWPSSSDPSDYTINRIPGDFTDISGSGFRLTLGDQQGIGGVPIGFDFNFYGTVYNALGITSNGYVTFSTVIANQNTPIPTTQLPNNFIAPFWDYLNPSLNPGGFVYYQTVGTAPDRRFIVQWDEVSLVSNASSRLTFEAILFESSGEIQFQYQTMTGGQGASGSSATIGIENADGTKGKEVAYNKEGAVTAGSAFSFTRGGNAFKTGRTLGDLDNDSRKTILDQSILTDMIDGSGKPRSALDLVLADVAPEHGTDGRPFGDGKIDALDHQRLFHVIMGRHTLNPTLSGVSPISAGPGDSITLYGSGFDCIFSNNTVIFTDIDGNTYSSKPTGITDGCTALIVTLPSGMKAITSISVVRNAQSSNALFFVLKNSPVITGLLPDGGRVGDSIVIRGYEFGFAPGDNAVSFNGRAGTVTAVKTVGDYDELTVIVPSNASTGPVTVTVAGIKSNGVIFTIDGPPLVSIDSPANNGEITSPVDIIGTAFDLKLTSYTLDYVRIGETEYTTIGSGTSSVNNGVLGKMDPTMLLNGLYTVRLRATDSDGYISTTSVTYTIKGDMKIGHFTVSFVDLNVPVAGIPIQVVRTYDSRDKGSHDFGYGWTMEVNSVKFQHTESPGYGWYGSVTMSGWVPNYCIDPTKSHNVSITMPDGKVHEFEFVLDKACQTFAPPGSVYVHFNPSFGTNSTLEPLRIGVGGKLEVVQSLDIYSFGWPGEVWLVNDITDPESFDFTLFRLTLPDGRAFIINRESGLQSITDLNGNTLNISKNGIISENPDVEGSSVGIQFVRDAQGRIIQIFDLAGNGMNYVYDGNGDLESFTDREMNKTTFAYDQNIPHYLKDIFDPLGRRVVRNEYFDDGRIKSHTDVNGNKIEYTHVVNGREEIVSDRLGGTRVVVYDERGNIIKEIQPDGTVIDREFDSRNNKTYETESYNPVNPPSPIPSNRFGYDGKDNLLWSEDALKNRTSYTYNLHNQLLTIRDPRGNWVINEYDPKGNIIKTESREGSIDGPVISRTRSAYNSRGKLIMQTVLINGQEQSMQYGYDAYGRMKKEVDARGHEIIYTYDANGNRKTKTTTRTIYKCTAGVCEPSGTETLTTAYEYDKMGRIRKTIDAGDPAGFFNETVYDSFGRQIEVYDKLRNKTSFEYDELGNLTVTRFADGTYEESEFNAGGLLIKHWDRAKAGEPRKSSLYEYDTMGRLVKMISQPANAGEPIEFNETHYDPAGNVDWKKDARGNITEYGYDAAGQRTVIRQLIDGKKLSTSIVYDENSNMTGVTDTNGRTVTYEYDALNRRTKIIFPPASGGSDATYAETLYDELGRRITEKDQAGKITRYEYDDLGRLAKVIQKLEDQDIVTSYGYDEIGNRISQTDAEGRTTWMQYNAQGRQISRILPDGSNETKQYDITGNLANSTDFMGRTTTYQYSVCCGRLVKKTYQNNDWIEFTYTSTGRRESATSSVAGVKSTIFYSYDGSGRLASIINPDGSTLEYAYNDNNARTSVSVQVGTSGPLVTAYSYDDLGRLQTVTDPVGRVYIHGYDDNGNRTSIEYPNGIRTEYAYDTFNRLMSLTTSLNHETVPEKLIQNYNILLGPAGARTRIVEHQGTSNQRTLDYGYDDLYRLKSESIRNLEEALVYDKTYTYDRVGNRQTQTTTGTVGSAIYNPPVTDTYSYDNRDRLTYKNNQSYEWDKNGNLISKSAEATYTWDSENRLIRTQVLNGPIVEHDYNVDGNLICTRTTRNGQTKTVHYIVDTVDGLACIIAETDEANKLDIYYVRGDDLLAGMRPITGLDASAYLLPSGWNSWFYHADGIGSVRCLTNETGVITDSYDYSAFGELVLHTGTNPQPYAFTGEPIDVNLNLQYHRARWMDPGIGRFLSIDSFGGTTRDPRSLHKYLYADSDPVNKTDPSGKFSLGGQLTVGFMIGALASMALTSYQAGMYFTHIPKDGLIKPPDGIVLGAQLSWAPGATFANKGYGNPFLWALALGTSVLSIFGAVEVVIPFQRPAEAWVFGLWGYGATWAIPDGNGLSLLGYGGLMWRAKTPSDWKGPFFCTGLGSTGNSVVGSGTSCVSPEPPKAYSLTAGVSTGSSVHTTLQTSQSRYYYWTTIPLESVDVPTGDQMSTNTFKKLWNQIMVTLGFLPPEALDQDM